MNAVCIRVIYLFMYMQSAHILDTDGSLQHSLGHIVRRSNFLLLNAISE